MNEADKIIKFTVLAELTGIGKKVSKKRIPKRDWKRYRAFIEAVQDAFDKYFKL